MTIGRQVRTMFGVLVAIQVMTSLAAIGLLARMSPAIGRILADNEDSMEHVEAMLAVLAHGEPSAPDRERYRRNLREAERNITEPAERAVLSRLRGASEAALSGDAGARATSVAALLELSQVNRDAMHRADDAARELGFAGRWALAILAILGILASAISLRRVRDALIEPASELMAVVRAREGGDRYRRCVRTGVNELTPALTMVNDLLDLSDRARISAGQGDAALARAALGALLDRADARLAIVDEDGALFAAGKDTLALLAEGGPELREALERADAQPIGGTALRIVQLTEETPARRIDRDRGEA